MAELIGFPNVEALVVSAVKEGFTTHLPGVGVGTKLVTGDFLRVTRTGGPRETRISENALVLLEAYAGSKERAIEILNWGRAILNSQDGQLFGVTEASGPANLPDPQTSQIRYTQLFGVRVRGSALA